jgi:hypothetical protein
MSHFYVSSLDHCVWSTMEDGTSLLNKGLELRLVLREVKALIVSFGNQ